MILLGAGGTAAIIIVASQQNTSAHPIMISKFGIFLVLLIMGLLALYIYSKLK